MKTKRVLAIVILIILVVAPAFCSFSYRPSVSGWLEGVFCVPTASYLKEYPGDPSRQNPPVRTSLCYGLDIDPLDISFTQNRNTFSFGVGASINGVSPSLSYGVSRLKPYSGLGANTYIAYCRESVMGVSLCYRFLTGSFIGTAQHFRIHEIELAPWYEAGELLAGDFCIQVPICASIKADAVSLRVGVAFTLRWQVFGRGV